MANDKVCTKCKKSKPIDLFHRNISSKDGYEGWCKDCKTLYKKENQETINENKRKIDHLIKEEVFTYYSGNNKPKCQLCPYDDIRALTLDHINNNGAIHRRENKSMSGIVLYRQLKKDGYPKGYQVLCYNCNIIKYREYRALFYNWLN